MDAGVLAGFAPEAESFGRVRDLFGQVRHEKIKVLLIELASLHPTTDLVLPFLTGLLEASNPVAIRREAAEGFDHHHDPRSVEILLRVARTDAASEVRAEAAETIGEVQTPQSVPALTDLATNSPDPAVRREAAEAFADQPPDLALPAIERLIATSVDDDALGEAIEALGEIHGCAGPSAAGPHRDGALEPARATGSRRDVGRGRGARLPRRPWCVSPGSTKTRRSSEKPSRRSATASRPRWQSSSASCAITRWRESRPRPSRRLPTCRTTG